MSLKQGQWCYLTTMQKNGSTPLQEILTPFETNPNVDIHTQPETQSVVICGTAKAVISAYDHITNQLNKDVHVQDRYDSYASVAST